MEGLDRRVNTEIPTEAKDKDGLPRMNWETGNLIDIGHIPKAL